MCRRLPVSSKLSFVYSPLVGEINLSDVKFRSKRSTLNKRISILIDGMFTLGFCHIYNEIRIKVQ